MHKVKTISRRFLPARGTRENLQNLLRTAEPTRRSLAVDYTAARAGRRAWLATTRSTSSLGIGLWKK